jgi:hypothetical protein
MVNDENHDQSAPALTKLVFPSANAISKLQTLVWFAARPVMYRELLRRVVSTRVRTQRFGQDPFTESEAGLDWCRRNVVPLEQVLEGLGVPTKVDALAETRPLLWNNALRAFEACGGTMGGPAHVNLLYHLVRHKRPDRVVETGVAAGWSSLAMLLAMEDAGHGYLTSIDMPYPKRGNDSLVGCVVPSPLRLRWSLVRRPDRDALPVALRGHRVGLAHYDSDKSYEGRMFAYQQLWHALEPEGLLISDDIEGNTAFGDFARDIGVAPRVLEKSTGNFVGILVR